MRGFVSEIAGRRLGKRDEVLVRAVGEVVRFAERMFVLDVSANDAAGRVSLGDGTIRNGSVGDKGNKVRLGDGPGPSINHHQDANGRDLGKPTRL